MVSCSAPTSVSCLPGFASGKLGDRAGLAGAGGLLPPCHACMEPSPACQPSAAGMGVQGGFSQVPACRERCCRVLPASGGVQAVFWGAEEPHWEKAKQNLPIRQGWRGSMRGRGRERLRQGPAMRFIEDLRSHPTRHPLALLPGQHRGTGRCTGGGLGALGAVAPMKQAKTNKDFREGGGRILPSGGDQQPALLSPSMKVRGHLTARPAMGLHSW